MTLTTLKEKLNETDTFVATIARLRVATGIRSNNKLFQEISELIGVDRVTLHRHYKSPNKYKSRQLLRSVQLLELSLQKEEKRNYRPLTSLL